MARAILDAWPDDHNIPIPPNPNKSMIRAMEEMAMAMAVTLLYEWTPEWPTVEFPQ